eukprot:gene1159-3964_t
MLGLLQGLYTAGQQALWPAAYLSTGSSVSIVSQIMNDAAIAHPNAQLVPLVKYSIAFLVSLACLSHDKPVGGLFSKNNTNKTLYIALMGLMDIAAYMMFILGFAACGAALSSVVHAASGQICTAVLRSTVLNRPLSFRQYTAVFVVSSGLALRSLPGLSAPGPMTTAPGVVSLPLGIAFIFGSAFTYSMLGVLYEINLGMAAVGAAGAAGYQ